MKNIDRIKLKKLSQAVLVGLSLSVANSVQVVHAASSYGLQDIYQMALSYDAKIAQAQAQYLADKESIATARGVLLPQVQADGSYFITDSDNDYADNNARNLSVTLNQSIYDHANWARYEQAKYSSEAADLTLQNAQQDLILRVAQAYFDVLLAQKTLQLSQNKEKADYTQYETAKASAELGLSSRVDVLEAKSSYDLSKSDTISAQNQLDITLEALANITGKTMENIRDHGLKALLPDVDLPKLELDQSKLEQQAQAGNLSILTAQTQLGQATEEISVKKAGHLPSVSFQAKYSDTDYSDFQAGSTFTDSETTTYGVNVTMPIFSGGRTSSEVTAAKQRTMAAQEALRDSQQSAKLAVRTQVRNLEQGEKLVRALREAVKSNDAFLESAEEGYRVGLKSMLEVLTARTNQTNAQRNLIEAIHNQVLNHLQLEASLGDLNIDDILKYEPLLQSPSS